MTRLWDIERMRRKVTTMGGERNISQKTSCLKYQKKEFNFNGMKDAFRTPSPSLLYLMRILEFNPS